MSLVTKSSRFLKWQVFCIPLRFKTSPFGVWFWTQKSLKRDSFFSALTLTFDMKYQIIFSETFPKGY